MDRVLQPHWAYAAAYLDDVVRCSKIWADHIQRVRAVLQLICMAGLRVNPTKYHLGKTNIRYLGYILSNGKTQLLIDKVEALDPRYPQQKGKILPRYG